MSGGKIVGHTSGTTEHDQRRQAMTKSSNPSANPVRRQEPA
jgi:hypothetical protein